MGSSTRIRHVLIGSRGRVARTVVVGLVLALVVVSLVVRSRLEARIAALASCRFAGGAHASASLPLTATLGAVFTGDLGTVTVRADGAHLGGLTADVVVRLQDVDTSGSPLLGHGSGAHVGSADATVTVAYADLASRFDGAEASYGGGSDVLLRRAGSAAGPQVRATLSYGDGDIVVTPTAVQLGGREIPLDMLGPLIGRAGGRAAELLQPHRIPLPTLPAGLRVGGVDAGPDGVSLHAAVDHPAAGAKTCPRATS